MSNIQCPIGMLDVGQWTPPRAKEALFSAFYTSSVQYLSNKIPIGRMLDKKCPSYIFP